MIKIRCIRALDNQFNILMIKYPDDLRFSDEHLIDKFMNNEADKWSRCFDQKVTVDIDYIDIPKQVNVLAVCKNTAAEMNITMEAMFGKTKNREVVEARIFACNICLDSGIPVSHIEEHTPWKNRVAYYYQSRLLGLRETEPSMDARYQAVYDSVMNKIMGNGN